MATSGSTNYTATRDQIITRALRIVGEVGRGETPTTEQISETAQAFNDVVKEFAGEGMQLWKRRTIQIPVVAGTGSYTIGTSATVNTTAPLKVLSGFTRTITGANDTPLLLMTESDYNEFPSKSSAGTPYQFFYRTPGPLTGGEMLGTLYLINVPDATFVATYTVWVTGIFPIEDMDSSTDNLDFPTFYINALVWALADDIAFEAGSPPTDRSQIAAKAKMHRDRAMNADTEEGSLYIQPDMVMFDRFWTK